jgi:hypothetical protein
MASKNMSDEQEFTEDMLEQMELEQEDQVQDTYEDNLLTQQEYQEAYPMQEPEEKQSAHSFLHKAAFQSMDTVRTTFLQQEELGKPLFSVRFLMDMEDISNYYVNPILKKYELVNKETNRISDYFWNKVQNITASGMSNKGFSMNLNVTRKMDSTRNRIKNIQQPNKKKE